MLSLRYRCAPLAALLLAGAICVLLPVSASAQSFANGMNAAWPDGGMNNQGWDQRPHFDRRRFEEKRREMERLFERERDRRDRHDHHDGFMAGMHVSMQDGARRDRPQVADKTHVSPGETKASAGSKGADPGTVGTSRTGKTTPVAAPGAAKNGPGGNSGLNQGQHASAKQGHGNQSANKNAPGNLGNLNNGFGAFQAGNRFNPQAGNFNNGMPGNQQFANRGNPFGNQQANAGFGNQQHGMGNMGQTCARKGAGNGSAHNHQVANNNNNTRMRGNFVGNGAPTNHHTGNNKGAGHHK